MADWTGVTEEFNQHAIDLEVAALDQWRDVQAGKAMNNPLLELWERFDGYRGHWLSRPNIGGDDYVRSMVARSVIRQPATSLYSWAIPDDAAINYIADTCSPIIEIGAGTGYWARCITEAGGDVIAFDATGRADAALAVIKENRWHRDARHWFDVRRGGPEDVAAHADRTLMLCWPPYRPTQNVVWTDPHDLFEGEAAEGWEPQVLGGGAIPEIRTWRKVSTTPCLAYDALVEYERAGGQCVVYVGEGSGGCTGSPQFHARLGMGCDCWNDDPCGCPEPGPWGLVKELQIPQWDGIHDLVNIFERMA